MNLLKCYFVPYHENSKNGRLVFCEFIAYLLKSPFDQLEKEQRHFDIVFATPLDNSNGDKFKTMTEFKGFFLDKFETFNTFITKVKGKKGNPELGA